MNIDELRDAVVRTTMAAWEAMNDPNIPVEEYNWRLHEEALACEAYAKALEETGGSHE